MKKEVKQHIKQHIYVVIFTLIFLALIHTLVPPTYTGHTVQETIAIPSFTYDENLIEITNSTIRLKATTTTTEWTTHSQEEFTISKAYYNPDNKLSKVQEQDDNRLEIPSSKIANFVFENPLDNANIITLYLKNEDTTNIYLCPPNQECTSSSNLGQVYFPDQTGYYNITIQNLDSPTKVFNLNSDEKIKVDFITSPQANISEAWYNPTDKTSKVNELDDTTFEVNKNKIFDILFEEPLQQGDILQLYLKQKNPTDIYLCDASTSCSPPGHGLLPYNGGEGWFNLTIANLENPQSSFNLDPTEIKPDFINALRVTSTDHSQTNTTYPQTANITTPDVTVLSLEKWDLLIVEQTLNNQTLDYEYSTDSGSTWFEVPEDYNISNATTDSQKIRIKAIFTSDTTATPIIHNINITYTPQPCSESWTCSDWTPETCPENQTQTRTCTDLNTCNTTTNKPLETQNCTYIPPSLPTYYDVNNTETISTSENTTLTINASSLNTELTILPTQNLNNIVFNITLIAEETRNSTLSRVKELEINAPELTNNIANATLKLYYTDAEIAGLQETSLKLYYYNETSQEWQALPTTVNTELNYLEANLEHFSIYGIFGETAQEESGGGGSSGGGGGGSDGGGSSGSSFRRGTTPPTETETPTQPQEPTQTPQPTEQTQQETIPVQTKTTLTAYVINISKILTSGKLNKVLWLLFILLILAYIITRLHEKNIIKLPKFKKPNPPQSQSPQA